MGSEEQVILILGSTGRIGRLVASLCDERKLRVATVNRMGDIRAGDVILGNFWDEGLKLSGDIYLADCSIDYSSIQNMVSYEEKKRSVIRRHSCRSSLRGYLTISSGAVDFADDDIQSNFHLAYKREKLLNEELAKVLVPVGYSPRIYTLIGPETYKNKSVGWVNVVDQCLLGEEIVIDERDELRSWVSERVLKTQFGLWLDGQGGTCCKTPISGNFKMHQIVEGMALRLEEPKLIRRQPMPGWLNVPYTAQEINCSDSLMDVIYSCIQG